MSQYWEATAADHDADTIAGLPSATAWQRRMAEELGPRDALATLPEPEPWWTTCDRPAQVIKALACLGGMADVWEARDELGPVDRYIRAQVKGREHPWTGRFNLRQYRASRPVHDAVRDAATMLRHGGTS